MGALAGDTRNSFVAAKLASSCGGLMRPKRPLTQGGAVFAEPYHNLLQPLQGLDLPGLMAQAGEAVVFVDSNWVARYCNDIYAADLGLSCDQVVGRTPFEYAPAFRRSIFFEATEQCLLNRVTVCRIGFSTVLNRWLMVRVFPVSGGMLMLANDATESVVKQFQLAQRATKDNLTSLGNKLAMEQRVSQLLQQRAAFSITVVGLDRLKDVNESHGYSAGDMALMEVASAMQTATLSGETLYRISGNEFAVVREHDIEESEGRAQAFIDAVRRPILLSGSRVVLGACAGVVDSPFDGQEYEVLLKRAGLAVKEAKSGGRGAVARYRAELELASQLRSVLEDELRSTLDGAQFVLMVQPKFSLSTNSIVGGEALIRWQHPERGFLAPGAFLEVAETMGAMVKIDQWVLRQSLKYCSTLARQGVLIPISINLSVDSLGDAGLADRVAQALDEAQVPPSMLEIEIPEGALMHDVKASALVLAQLHDMGVRISVDDFGTGYSSFAYLAQFPVHALKIDRSFIDKITANETNLKIVQGIVRLAHSLSLEVVAEGAEDNNQVALLQTMKCDTVQGYALSRPLSWADFEKAALQTPRTAQPDPMAI